MHQQILIFLKKNAIGDIELLQDKNLIHCKF